MKEVAKYDLFNMTIRRQGLKYHVVFDSRPLSNGVEFTVRDSRVPNSKKSYIDYLYSLKSGPAELIITARNTLNN